MALSDWLSKLKQYGQNAMAAYGAGQQESAGLPAELAARQQMQQGALSPAPLQNAPMAPPVAGMAPYEQVNPGYKPIGGANAMNQLMQGRPPRLR
jgi:hypothetical protein